MRAGWLVVGFGLAGCTSGAIEIPVDPVELVVDSPSYGEFLGSGPIEVTGSVSPVDARLTVEGQPVVVDEDGRFAVQVPFEDRYRVIDVVAVNGPLRERVRVPVFDGQDPLLTWPGAVTLRLTPNGLDRIGETLAATIDGSNWTQSLADGLTTLGSGGFVLNPVGVVADPTVVLLTPAEGTIDAEIILSGIQVQYELVITLGSFTTSSPVNLGLEEVVVGLSVAPRVAEGGMLEVEVVDANIAVGDPIIELGTLDSTLIESVLGFVLDLALEPLNEQLLASVLDAVGVLPLGGPYEFSADLFGSTVNVALSEAYADVAGLGAALGVMFDAPVAIGPTGVPAPGIPVDPRVDVAIGLHEGLLQRILIGTATQFLAQDIQLPGPLGEVIGNGIRALPGGATVPATDGWCLSIEPQPAQVVRLQTGLVPFATLYMPDLIVDIGLLQSGTCVSWLKTTMEAKLALQLEGGTALGFDVEFVGGSIESYLATGEWTEEEVIAGLGRTLGGLVSILGSFAEFDLADLTAGAGDTVPGLEGLQPALVTNEPLVGVDGSVRDGLYSVGIQLWP